MSADRSADLRQLELDLQKRGVRPELFTSNELDRLLEAGYVDWDELRGATRESLLALNLRYARVDSILAAQGRQRIRWKWDDAQRSFFASVAAVPEFNKNMWMLFMMLYVGGIIMVAFLTSWPRTVPLVLCGCITPLLLAKRYMGDGFRFVMQALSEVWAAARSAGAKAIMLACICSPWYAFRVLLWVLLWAPPTLCIGTVALMGPYVALLGPMFIFGVVILLAILHRQPPPAEAVANLLWVMADIRSTTGEHLLSFSFVQQAQECGASLLLQWIDCPQWAGPAAGVVCLLGLDSASNSGGVEAEAVAVEE